MDILYLNIKKRRTDLGMSQRDLAKKIGYKDHTTICDVENGKIDLPFSRIKQYADALQLSVAQLIGLEEW